MYDQKGFIILKPRKNTETSGNTFPLPTGDIFSNRMVWFEDDQISAELVQMRLLAPEQWGMPLPL
ncbi:hypothetical protein GLN27_04710, partial [Shigella flexneri]|nr:hypothetical protein [Shigella flexneri]